MKYISLFASRREQMQFDTKQDRMNWMISRSSGYS